eukprot:scaffold397495_cov33-Attheya_sp.AAC.2
MSRALRLRLGAMSRMQSVGSAYGPAPFPFLTWDKYRRSSPFVKSKESSGADCGCGGVDVGCVPLVCMPPSARDEGKRERIVLRLSSVNSAGGVCSG